MNTSPRSISLKHYLTGAIGTTALLAGSQSDAAVVAVNLGDNVFDSNAFNSVSSVANNSVTFGGLRNYINNYVYIGTNFGGDYGKVYRSAGGLAQFLDNGTQVGGGSLAGVGVSLRSGYFMKPGGTEYGTDQLNENIGFRTSAGNYGWANVDWNRANKTVTINSAYVESVVGNSINVGAVEAVPEPSRALLALAGIAGVALRRRRSKRAA